MRRRTPSLPQFAVGLACTWFAVSAVAQETRFPASGGFPNAGQRYPLPNGEYGGPLPGEPAGGVSRSTQTEFGVPSYETRGPAPFGNAPQEAPGNGGFTPPPGESRSETRLSLFSPAQIVAKVGNEPILLGELIGNQGDKVPMDQLEPVLQRLLSDAIDMKILYLEFLRTAPKDRLPQIESQIAEAFEETQLPAMMKKAGVETPLELDAVLRETGNSLAKQRRLFIERMIAQSTLRRNVNQFPDVSNDEIRRYYQERAAEYAIPAQSRWEKLTARFADSGGREAAWQLIAAMGNEVLGGAPLSAVARRSSQSLDAEEGGLHDWTSRGSLRSKPIDEALFTLPLNRLSQIIEDEEGFHIVRVLERREAGAVPFTEAQVKIKEKIREQKITSQGEEYLAGLRRVTPIWTIFEAAESTASQGNSPQSRYELPPR